MFNVFVRQGLVGEDGTEMVPMQERPGLNGRILLNEIERRMPGHTQVQIGVNGRLMTEAELDRDFADGDTVIVCPVTGYGIEWIPLIVYALVAAVVGAAVNYAIQALSPRPKPPGAPQERGDTTSPTYSWDGIATSYGQGFPVPAVYGRHAVGGQVIYTDVFATTAAGIVDDRLNVILALSEGPIARIGDLPADPADGLGGVSGGVAGPPLPGFIRVNEVRLESTNVGVQTQFVQTLPWSNGPTFGSGALLDVLDPSFAFIGQIQVIQLNSLQTDFDYTLLSGSPPIPGRWLRDNTQFPQPQAQVTVAATVVRLNQTPGAVAYLRPGTMDQPELPSSPFRGTSVSFSPNAQLDEVSQESIYAYEGTDEITTIGFVFAAPGGLFVMDAQGNLSAYPVALNITWRPEGTQTWRGFWVPSGASVPLPMPIIIGDTVRTGPVLMSLGANLVAPSQPKQSGPIEVRVVRQSPSGGTGAVSSVIWRNVFFNTANVLRYPRVALLGLTLTSGARFNGGLPSFNVRIDGIKVRLWDATYGFSPRTWDRFTTGSWSFATGTPGRNPAWVLLDFLTSPWGLGKYLKDSDLDLPSFRRWAAFCDTDASPSSPWNNPQFQCDLVIDAPRPAWEWVLAICAAGRASPIYRAGKIGVVYEYRDMHSDSGVTVGAKTPVQLITSGNCEKVQVSWLPKANRPTAFAFQFLNEDLLHKQDVFVVEDPFATFNDPTSLNQEQWRPETIQAYGVTRPAQIYREGIYRHRVSRLVRRELTFVTGRWALAAEVGDLIEFEHEMVRPFGDDVPNSLSVRVGGTGVYDVTVDHVLFAGTEFVYRDANGAPQHAVIDSLAVDGSETILTLSTPVTVAAGAACAVGLTSKVIETYQIVAITLQKDLKREVRCLQWVPEIHDPVTPADYVVGGGDSMVDEPSAIPAEPAVDLTDVAVIPMPTGSHRIGFGRQPNRTGVTARVYVRETTASRWTLAGATEDSFVEYEHFVPGKTYQIALCFESFDGDAPLPDQGLRVSFTAEEFPPYAPPAVSNVRATALDAGLLVEWDSIDMLTLQDYEVRLGGDWNTARVIYRGRSPRASISPPPVGAPTVLVAARLRSNLYGAATALVLPSWTPPGTVEVIGEDDFAPSPSGTHSDTQWTGGTIQLASGKMTGTYTSVAQDAGYQAAFYWSVQMATETLDDGVTVNDATWKVDSGESLWRTVNGRQSSAASPGIDFERTVDDVTTMVDDLPGDLLVAGNRGEAGATTRVLVESRFEVSGVWSSYKQHEDRTVIARKMQVRVTIDRESLLFQPRILGLTYRAHI